MGGSDRKKCLKFYSQEKIQSIIYTYYDIRSMNRLKLTRTSSLTLVGALSLLTLSSVAASSHSSGMLKETDMVGVSFWIATAMMLASTVFFI